jgi:addiction module HigA family antidote
MNPNPQHPGTYVREHVIPKSMKVTAAAVRLDVSRPALSNFLNGKADLSPMMAARLEATFGVSARKLLDQQSAWDATNASRTAISSAIRAYVPPFLQIKAVRIEAWANTGIEPRRRLSVFLRTLINSTGSGLRRVDFPGNDDSERPGWDGRVSADDANPWIPAGESGWEFGVTDNAKSKADGDFAKSVIAVEPGQRKKMTFVFVTPQRWDGKGEWIKVHKAKKLWKDVRAYDASDLEQWLEQSIQAQTWFANETGQDALGAISLDEAWKAWQADCALSPLLFADSVRESERILRNALTTDNFKPVVITADSKDEALGFLSAAFAADKSLGAYRDRIVVFREPGALSRFGATVSNIIPVIISRDVEKEFAPFRSAMPSFIIYPRNAVAEDPDIELETLNREAFENALREMNIDDDRIDLLGRESGRSPTVLRRRLSNLHAIRTPDWATEGRLGVSLIPFLFAGAWWSDNPADKAMLEVLSGDVQFADLERRVTELLPMDSAPVWSVGAMRGVVSKIDLLFAVREKITQFDLQRFFDVAELVLSEVNPALDLPEEDRWKAGIFGRKREISGPLRNGLAETLVLLSVYGANLFKGRIDFDAARHAEQLVRSLLVPLTARTLESQADNLSLYAEAAPETFLSIIEGDLRTAEPETLALMRPTSNPMFSSSPRTGLLWALEGLAWSDKLFMRTVLVLGRLAERKIDDNLSNRPSNSLSAIFRSWMPQTSTDLAGRKAALAKLAEVHPSVAWPICVEQFAVGSRFGMDSHKPRWRPDGHGFGAPVTIGESDEFSLFAFRRVMRWPVLTVDMAGDLLKNLTGLEESLQLEVWDRIDQLIDAIGEGEKAHLREKIRVSTMTRRARKGDQASQASADRAKGAYQRLEPADPILRHAWLFAAHWVEESADELANASFDHRSRTARIERQREAAVQDVMAAVGTSGLVSLAEKGQAQTQVGWAFAAIAAGDDALERALVELVEGGDVSGPRANVIRGALDKARMDKRSVLAAVVAHIGVDKRVPLLVAAPFDHVTWGAVKALREDLANQYWQDVVPHWNRDPDDLIFGVTQLMEAGRPRAAFNFAHLDLDQLPGRVLYDLLVAIARGSGEEPKSYMLDQSSLSDAFEALNSANEVGTEAMAALEFQYIDIFDSTRVKPVNLEKQIAESPEWFVQAIRYTFKRGDGNIDPPEPRADDDNYQFKRASSAYKLLNSLTRIPGQDKEGLIDVDKLIRWIDAVRIGCAAIGRSDVGDQMLGKLLSHAPADESGVWPCLPVRDALERVMTDHMDRGLHIALLNARGAHFRGPGGAQERELAQKYGGWAEEMEYTHPRIATLLRGMERSYLRDAEREDGDARINRRLGN